MATFGKYNRGPSDSSEEHRKRNEILGRARKVARVLYPRIFKRYEDEGAFSVGRWIKAGGTSRQIARIKAKANEAEHQIIVRDNSPMSVERALHLLRNPSRSTRGNGESKPIPKVKVLYDVFADLKRINGQLYVKIKNGSTATLKGRMGAYTILDLEEAFHVSKAITGNLRGYENLKRAIMREKFPSPIIMKKELVLIPVENTDQSIQDAKKLYTKIAVASENKALKAA